MRREEFGFVIVKTAEPYLSDSILSPLSQSTYSVPPIWVLLREAISLGSQAGISFGSISS